MVTGQLSCACFHCHSFDYGLTRWQYTIFNTTVTVSGINPRVSHVKNVPKYKCKIVKIRQVWIPHAQNRIEYNQKHQTSIVIQSNVHDDDDADEYDYGTHRHKSPCQQTGDP